MNKVKFTIILLIAVFVISAIYPVFLHNIGNSTTEVSAEDDAEWDEETSGGTGSNPDAVCTVLEIVPYVGNQEIGYLVGGEEPIEEALVPWDDVGNIEGIMKNAMDYYNSYEDEWMNPSGTYNKTASTLTYQTGYFQKQDSGGAGLYSISAGTSYIYVGSGNGNYSAQLDTQENPTFYSELYSNDLMNQKNVKAYFVQKPTTLPLMPNNNKVYYPSSVTERNDNSGDYDYNPATESFILNKDHGDYDVLFSTSVNKYNSSGAYYMTNDYSIVTDNSGDYSWNLKYKDVGAKNGDFVSIPYKITYQKDSGGNYKWYPSATAPNNAQYNTYGYYVENAGQTNEKIWVKGQRVNSKYRYTYHFQLVNNEWFKRFALGISADKARDYKVDVIAITPTDLNKAENQHYINEADLIYISNFSHNSYITLYESYSTAGKIAKAEGNHVLSFEQNDLSWESVEKIFKRAAGVSGGRPAIVMDSDVYLKAYQSYSNRKTTTTYDAWDSQNNYEGTTNNIAKLYLMLMQRDTGDFYDAFMNPDNPSPYKIIGVSVSTSVSASGTTGSFVRPDSGKAVLNADHTRKTALYQSDQSALYWNENTFVPFDIQDNGTVVKYCYNEWNNAFQYNIFGRSVYQKDDAIYSLMDDGTKLWRVQLGYPLPAAVKAVDTVIYYLQIKSSPDELKKYIPNYNVDNDTTNLNDNVYVRNSSEIFAGTVFLSGGSGVPSTNTEEIDKINAHLYANNPNASPTTSFTIADIMNFITNNGMGYGNTGTSSNTIAVTRVLNIQPTADFTDSEAKIRTMLADYSLKIDNITSTQFNSKITDINTQYDLIYIGNGIGRFNTNTVNSVKSTVFNDTTQNGSIYMNPGDKITLSDGSVKNYTGNDITASKKQELLDFMSAGYPVILESNLYNYSGQSIKNAVNLKSFIDAAKTNTSDRMLNMGDYIGTDLNKKYSFMGKIINGLVITKPKISLNEPILTGTDINYYYPTDGVLRVKYMLFPHNNDSIKYKYNTYIYIDKNGDGIFSQSERLTLSSDSSNSINIDESIDNIYSYRYNMAGKNGAYQWKLLAERTDNPYIRSEVTGYVASTNKKTIKILQIIDSMNSDNYHEDNLQNYSLQAASGTPGNKVNEYGGFAPGKELRDYSLEFTTMTVQAFLNLYAQPGKNYTSATAETTNQLAGYHLIILDNQIDTINDNHGALSNIKDEIARGMGVVFTKGSVTAGNQSNYLNPADYLFDTYKTYQKLNNSAKTSPTQYYLYDLSTSGYNYDTTTITKSNVGAIAEYPYNIGNYISIAAQSYNIDSIFDFSRADAIPLIGWYCLSDTKSPVVDKYVTNPYTGIFSTAPNDVKNNYYLVNRGKIYYSGIQLNKAITAGNSDEIKLFINTILSVYKTTGRTISAVPVINMINPIPITGTITINQSDLVGKSEYPIIFEISESSSNMNIGIDWDDNTNISGNWNQLLYSVEGTTFTPVSDMNNIPNGTYAVKIPKSDLPGTHSLVISAQNQEGRTGTATTTILCNSEPPTVTINNPELVYKSSTERYLYVDIDQSAEDSDHESDYLNAADPIKIHFTISDASENCLIQVLNSEGAEVTIVADTIYTDNSDVGEVDQEHELSEKLPSGDYYVWLPASIMSSISSKDITVKAIMTPEEGGYGSDTVTLLRRSLFQLD